MRRHLVVGLVAVVLCGIGVWTAGEQEECTSLVATGTGTVDGAALLWKNRDNPSELSNKVVFVDDKPYSYLALVDGEPGNGRLAWAALNAAGFAVANTATTNLPPSEPSGNPSILMGDAARTCATVDEFEQFLQHNFGKNRGTRSNFLAVDAKGGAAILETHANGVKRLNAVDAPEQYLGNTNFSRSGTPDQGGGYLRFDREAELLKAVPSGKLSVDYVLQVMSRDLGHTLLHHPDRSQWRTYSPDTPVWLHTNYTIDRPSTASVFVIHNVRPGEDPRRATMWVILGEPLTSVAVPLWVAAGSPPAELWEGKDAALLKESARLKDILRPLKSAERHEYVDVTRLDNSAGTGWLPATLAAERENLTQADELLKRNPSAAELAAFEKTVAARTLAVLASVSPASPARSALADAAAALEKNDNSSALTAVERAVTLAPKDADTHLLKCRVLARLRRHEEAIGACSESLRLRPGSPDTLRDRGHYYLNLGRIDLGLADLREAESRSKNDRGIYYHLGMAYYLKGDFAAAAKAYQGCVTNSNDAGARIECDAWLYPSLRRSGREPEARELLDRITLGSLPGHPGNYLDRILLFKGARTEQDVAGTMSAEGALSETTVGYGIGLWHLLNGRRGQARTYFEKAVATGYTVSWGYRASEAELKRLR